MTPINPTPSSAATEYAKLLREKPWSESSYHDGTTPHRFAMIPHEECDQFADLIDQQAAEIAAKHRYQEHMESEHSRIQAALMSKFAADLAERDATIERLKKFHEGQREALLRARPLCPDCRDKCKGEACLRCQNQRLAREFDDYMKSLAEYLEIDMEDYSLPSAHGNDRLRWAVLIAEKMVRPSQLAAATKEGECPLEHLRCSCCGCAVHSDGTCNCEDNPYKNVAVINRSIISKLRKELADIRGVSTSELPTIQDLEEQLAAATKERGRLAAELTTATWLLIEGGYDPCNRSDGYAARRDAFMLNDRPVPACQPMTGVQLSQKWKELFRGSAGGYEHCAWNSLSDLIWPQPAPQPDRREELRGEIKRTEQPYFTICSLGKRTACRVPADGGWAFVGDDGSYHECQEGGDLVWTPPDAENAAEDWLIDQVEKAAPSTQQPTTESESP